MHRHGLELPNREETKMLIQSTDPQVIIELLCGPLQHNEHCRAWRWHLYVRDDAARFDAVNAELVKMREERRARRIA